MKIAFAGKGGVGKTTLAAWTGQYLAEQGNNVWLIDADATLSLGAAMGLDKEQTPIPLIQRKDVIEERMGSGILRLNPTVSDLPDQLAMELQGCGPGRARLLAMGTVNSAGGGCVCGANALLKALLAHIVLERDEWAVIDLEAGVEHLGRGTVAAVDALVIVTEPSRRGFDAAATISGFAAELGLTNQLLALNRWPTSEQPLPADLPPVGLSIPFMPGLAARQLADPSVLRLPEQEVVNRCVQQLLDRLRSGR